MDELFRYLQNLIAKDGPIADDYPQLDLWFQKINEAQKSGMLDEKGLSKLRNIWGEALSVETCQGFSFLKPHGYAGDYEIIDKLYTRYVSPNPRLTRWDEYYHHHEAAKAVRNRRAYLDALISAHLERKKKLKILNVASGPGRDMHFFFQNHASNGSRRVYFDCIDHDEDAINFARNLCRDHLGHISFTRGNILRYRTAERYDIVWASGIFDYFNDRLFVRILGKLLSTLDRGGECVIGNFSAENPTKNYMEILGWNLYHRTPERLCELAGECGVPENRISIGRDGTGVNLFLHIEN